MAYCWRFPVPFMRVFAFGPWSFSFSLTTALVLRRRSLSREYRGRQLRFIPSFVMQLSQILIYPACSAAFEVMNDWQRVIFVVCLPLLRRAVKRRARATLSRYSSDFEQLADVACAVEIASSIYQVMIMQAIPTVISTSVIIGFDVIQGLISIVHFFEKRSVVAQHSIIPTAAEILARHAWAMESTATYSKQPVHDSFNVSRPISKSSSKVLSIKRRSSSNTQLSREDAKIVVRHALEVLNAAEII